MSTRTWASFTFLACTACGSTPTPAPTVAPQAEVAPPVAVAEVDLARTTYGCATNATSTACVAVAGFASGHAPGAPTRGRAYIGLTQCPPGALPPDVGMATVLVATTRDGELALHTDPTMTTSDVIDALAQALRTPGNVPENAEARRIYESARTTPTVVDDLTTLPVDASLDARTFNAWMVREHDGNLYELDHADSDGNVCVTTFRPVADVEVSVAPPGPAMTIDMGEVADTPPPPTADADVVAFMNARWSDIEAVAARAVGPCTAQQIGASPARGTAVASWSETLGVAASCMTPTSEGAAIGSRFLPLGDPEGPMGSWAQYRRDGTLGVDCEDPDCSYFSVFRGDPRLVSARIARPLPSGRGWVTVEVLLRR